MIECVKEILCVSTNHMTSILIKKHVLVFDGHRSDTENQELQKYKNRSIMNLFFKRSEATTPHEPESVSKFSRNARPREGNLHSADNKGGVA